MRRGEEGEWGGGREEGGREGEGEGEGGRGRRAGEGGGDPPLPNEAGSIGLVLT